MAASPPPAKPEQGLQSVEGEAAEQQDTMLGEPIDAEAQSAADEAADSIGNTVEMSGESTGLKPARARRTRKSPTAGKPAARKSTGAKASPRRSKPAAPSAR
jgi:hypothetical protein